MTNGALAMLLVAAGCAAIDWGAVATKNKRLEYVFKPATMAALIVAALLVDPSDPARRTWFVVAFVLSMAGDIFLMLPRDLFIFGLSSFLLAHVAFIFGIKAVEHHVGPFFIALAGVLLIAFFLLRPIVTALKTSKPELRVPIVLYMLVISVMVASALTSDGWIVAVAAVSFLVSDYLIARNRFLSPAPWLPLAIIVTYHLAQGAFLISIA
jgi:alkenylglycerophosphocholine/alkenylglycerophosphoethanolamine hydrolase